MVIRQQFKTASGHHIPCWALVESYRTEREPRQPVVDWLRKLDEAGGTDCEELSSPLIRKDTIETEKSDECRPAFPIVAGPNADLRPDHPPGIAETVRIGLAYRPKSPHR